MKRDFLILPIIIIAASFRWFYLLKLDLSFDISSFVLNLMTIITFYFFLTKTFNSVYMRILPAVFLAISPWHISLLQQGFLVNLYLSIFLLFFFLITKPLFSKSKALFSFSLILLLFIFSPVNIKQLFYFGISNQEIILMTDEQRREHGLQNFVVTTLHNKFSNYTFMVLNNYSNHFSAEILYLRGDRKQNIKPADVGLMYLFDFLFIIFGLIRVWKEPAKFQPYLIWLLLAPLPSSLIYDPFISLTSSTMIVPLTLISALGFSSLIKQISRINGKLGYLFFSVLFVVVLWDISHFLYQLGFKFMLK